MSEQRPRRRLGGGKGNLLLPRARASEKPDTNQTHLNRKDHTSYGPIGGNQTTTRTLGRGEGHILTKHSTRHSLQNLHQDSVLELLEDERPQLREGRVTSAYAGSREWSKFTTLTIDHSLTTRVFSTTSFTCFRFSEAASQSFTMKTFFNKLEKLTGVDLDGDGTIGGTQQCKGIATMHWRV